MINGEKEVAMLDSKKKKDLADRVKGRMIVKEILDFGVSDNQVREIIKILSLELEDRNVMLKIFEVLGDAEAEEQKEIKIYT